MADKLVTIARFTDYIEAEMAKQLLDDFGIESVVTGQNVATLYSGVPAAINIELQTLESQAEKALEILQSESESVYAPPDDEQEQ
jgi:hypothetical protein